MKRTQFSLCCLGVAAVMAVSSPAAAMAASLSDYDEATQEKLLDDTLEYNEIRALVSLFNPSMQQAQITMDDSLSVYRNGMTEYKDRAAELRREADRAEDDGDLQAYATYEMNAQIMNALANQYKDVVEQSERMSTQRSIVSAEDMLTRAVQQMVQGYAQLDLGCQVAEKGVELAQAAYDSALTQQSLGMATDADVKSAANSLASAQAGLKSAQDSRASLKSSICLMTGWDYDADITIGAVPEPDLEAIDSVDVASDTERAVNNNYDLVSLRHESRATSTVKQNVRDRNLQDTEASVRIAMESLYETLQQQRTSWDGADAAWQKAVNDKAALDQKYQLGMVGRLEYLQGELTYLQAQSAKLFADISLRKAYEDYLWQVKGVTVTSTESSGQQG